MTELLEGVRCPKCRKDSAYQEENEKGIYCYCEDCNLFFNPDGSMLETHKAVCPQCDGEGKHTNPSIDGNGLSYDDFAEDPDFEEGYFSGRYDIRCTLCDGDNVVTETIEDWDNAAFVAMVNSAREYEQMAAESAAERAMGA